MVFGCGWAGQLRHLSNNSAMLSILSFIDDLGFDIDNDEVVIVRYAMI